MKSSFSVHSSSFFQCIITIEAVPRKERLQTFNCLVFLFVGRLVFPTLPIHVKRRYVEQTLIETKSLQCASTFPQRLAFSSNVRSFRKALVSST